MNGTPSNAAPARVLIGKCGVREVFPTRCSFLNTKTANLALRSPPSKSSLPSVSGPSPKHFPVSTNNFGFGRPKPN